MGIFIAWQYYLESHIPPTPTPSSPPSVSPSPTPPKKWIPPPPLMRLSIWSRAQYRFSIVLIIAFLCWSAFLSWSFWVQLYYQDYVGLSPILTVVRLLPMFVTGVICNIVIAVVIGRVPVVYIVGTSPPPLSPSSTPTQLIPPFLVMGTTLTGTASLLFALISPSSPYWSFGFPASIVGVFGADFVFASGTLFVAKVALPHEQSVGGALFQTMTQVTKLSPSVFRVRVVLTYGIR